MTLAKTTEPVPDFFQAETKKGNSDRHIMPCEAPEVSTAMFLAI